MIANILSRSNLRAVFSKRYEEHAIKHSPGSPLSPLGTDQKTTQLLRTLEKAELRHWPPPKQAGHYFRRNRKTEINSILTLVCDIQSPIGDGINTLQETSASAGDVADATAILTISFHSKPTKASDRNEVWADGWVLDSVQSFLSTQTLQCILDALLCSSNTIKSDQWSMDNGISPGNSAGMIVDQLAFGEDYWLRSIQELQRESTAKLTASRIPMSQQTLGALSLKIQQPCWLYHHGSCVHCWTIESVRLCNTSDHQYSYPLALYMSTWSYPTCPHCGRNPVAWVVNGDIRLGESPSRLCTACWSLMGPSDDPDVIVLPFPS